MDFASPESWITGIHRQGMFKEQAGFCWTVGLVGVGPVLGDGFKYFWYFHPENWGRFPF